MKLIILQYAFLLCTLTPAARASYTQEESNEDAKSSFNVVSTLSGGSESSRRHTKTRHGLNRSQAADAIPAAGNLISASYAQGYEQQHFGHSHAAGAACTETRDHNSIASAVDTHDIDDPHGHMRNGDSTSVAGLLDVRNASPGSRAIPHPPVTYNGNAPNLALPYAPSAYPPPYRVYPPGPPPSHMQPALPPGAYYQPPMQHAHFPNPNDAHYRPPAPLYPTDYEQHSYPQYSSHSNPHSGPRAEPHYNFYNNPPYNLHHTLSPHGHGHEHGHHHDSWNSHLKLNTEYKEDGVHTGLTNALTNSRYGFGSGFGGGFNGAFNRPNY